MSALILPDRRLALPGIGPRRWSDWLRVLPFQKWDVGGCDCHCGTSCTGAGAPCTLPAANLTVTKTTGGVCTPDPDTYTLLYGGNCTWNSACQTETCSGIPAYTTLIMGIVGGCFYFGSIQWGNPGCTGTQSLNAYQNPAGCYSASGPMTLHSSSCSPLQLVFKNGGFTWTVTP